VQQNDNFCHGLAPQLSPGAQIEGQFGIIGHTQVESAGANINPPQATFELIEHFMPDALRGTPPDQKAILKQAELLIKFCGKKDKKRA
jgi:hypothetical protein